MYKIVLIALYIATTITSTGVQAGTTQTGKVGKLIIGREGHQVYINIKDIAQTCNKDHGMGFNYAFSLRDHEAGKEILSALMAAQIANKQVTVQGFGTCTITESMEDVHYIYLLNE